MIKRKISDLVQWIFDNILTSQHKRKVRNILTKQQKETLKDLFKSGKRQSELAEIETVKKHLTSLGFTKKAYDDLLLIYSKSKSPFQRKVAAWELALWHANLLNPEDAKKCLEFLPHSLKDENDKEELRRIAILKAECLETLGDVTEANTLIRGMINNDPHPDLILAKANLESSLNAKVELINQLYLYYGLTKIDVDYSSEKETNYDRLRSSVDTKGTMESQNKHKVTVIIPAYNNEDLISTSINSLLVQTWSNLEILVVDDCSTDKTAEIVERISQEDARVKLLRTEQNGGAYVARNEALKIASGDFVTIHDADDWSHHEKIERQVVHLLTNRSIIGNTSQQARATNELKFYRRGKPGYYIFSNMSSFMFRKDKVMHAVGYWDNVRFGGDSEFIKRIRKTFGEKSVVELETGPLSFQRQSETSLTGNQAFGFPGYFMGARKEYAESHEYYHQTNNKLYYPYAQDKRPFPVPEPMLPNKSNRNERRSFDVIIVSDFRAKAPITKLIYKKILAYEKSDRKVGFVQMSDYNLNLDTNMDMGLRGKINGKQSEMIVFGEKIKTKEMIIIHPSILAEHQEFIPDIIIEETIEVIVDEMKLSSDELKNIEQNLFSYFGQTGLWHPLNTQIKTQLLEYIGNNETKITLVE